MAHWGRVGGGSVFEFSRETEPTVCVWVCIHMYVYKCIYPYIQVHHIHKEIYLRNWLTSLWMLANKSQVCRVVSQQARDEGEPVV